MASSSLRRCCLPALLIRCGSSTSQTNLAKIIAIISTVPPVSSPLLPEPSTDVDLDLKLGPSQEMRSGPLPSASGEANRDAIPTANSGVVDPLDRTEESTVGKGTTEERQVSTAESSALEMSSTGECSPDVDRNQQKDATEASEIITYTKVDDLIRGETKGSATEGYLGLLLEAARQVAVECGDEGPVHEKASKPTSDLAEGSGMRKSSTTSAARSKRRRTRTATMFDVYEETEPVVRSNRGRNQALPSRFRDSVLEPWRKLPTMLRR
ncbi:hypothetical protein HPP92_009543 [Vanilla planifolia]|uniref:Uncharacterized protein n=1 Tax=Vanilla planifolia TaxID=51239 RepID=A0A835V7I3_VANPL|nr:hypothetical protein HPP92_009543 [Vanilla planifolia]